MKRFLVLGLPILMTTLVFGLGFFLIRSRGGAIQARFGPVRKAVAEVVENVAEHVEEVLE